MSLLMCQIVSLAQQRNWLQQKVSEYNYLFTFPIYLFSMVVIKDLLALCEDKCFLVHFQHFIFHPIFRILQSAPASCSNLAMFSCPYDTYFQAFGSVPDYPLPCLPSNPETLTLGKIQQKGQEYGKKDSAQGRGHVPRIWHNVSKPSAVGSWQHIVDCNIFVDC